VDEIKHPIVRKALKLLDLKEGIEITSIADVPSNTGLGSSSAFTVGLLNALHTYKREKLSAKELAEEACYIEIELLGEPIGKQDQYVSAYGGIICMEIDKLGNVGVNPVHLSEDALDQFESNTLLFYTGIKRSASEILSSQNKSTSSNRFEVLKSLHQIKEIGRKVKNSFEKGTISEFGKLLDLHWQTKRNLSKKVSSEDINSWYNLAKKNGALGGKIMGAGGGGFFMFYCDNGKNGFRKAMENQRLKEMRFHLDFEGSKVLINI